MEETKNAPEPSETKTSSTPHAPYIVPTEQGYTVRAAIGRHKNHSDYLKRGEEGIAEYRRMIQEELERELAKEGK